MMIQQCTPLGLSKYSSYGSYIFIHPANTNLIIYLLHCTFIIILKYHDLLGILVFDSTNQLLSNTIINSLSKKILTLHQTILSKL